MWIFILDTEILAVLFVQLGGGVGRYMGSGSKRKINMRVGEDVLSRLWSRVQTNNGIMVHTHIHTHTCMHAHIYASTHTQTHRSVMVLDVIVNCFI